MRITYIRRNLLPYLQQGLGLQNFDSMDDFDDTCRRLEDIQVRRHNFNLHLWKGLAYQGPHPPVRFSSVRSEYEEPNIEAAQATRLPKSMACWNCKQPGHRSINCPAPRNLSRKRFVKTLNGRVVSSPVHKSTISPIKSTNNQVVVSYLLTHIKNNQRPYVQISIIGIKLFGCWIQVLADPSLCGPVGNNYNLFISLWCPSLSGS